MALACSAVAFAVGVAHAAPNVGKVVTFKDWTAGCDNGLACQAVALMPESMPEDSLSVVVKRGEAVNAPIALELSGAATKSDRYRILVNGRTAISGRTERDSDFISLNGAEALKLTRSMARGKTIELVDGSGAKLGSASLAGAAAALRYLDAQQGRAGSRGAIVAVGKRRATAKKAIVPVITAKKIAPTDNLPDAGSLVALSESSPCAVDRFGSTQDTAYSLGSGESGAQALVLLNCGSGAYNFSYGVYVGTMQAGNWTFAPATFDYAATGFGEESNIPIVVNADWDSATQSLGGYSKGRGLGDCGSSESYVWDGSMFRLTSATLMGECRGSLDWIPVWRAEVRLIP